MARNRVKKTEVFTVSLGMMSIRSTRHAIYFRLQLCGIENLVITLLKILLMCNNDIMHLDKPAAEFWTVFKFYTMTFIAPFRCEIVVVIGFSTVTKMVPLHTSFFLAVLLH